MTARQTFYEILGVAPDAEPAEIEAVWLRAARDLHPDAGGTLVDPQLRADYDRSSDQV